MINNKYMINHVDYSHLRFIDNKFKDAYLDIPLDLYRNCYAFPIDTNKCYDIGIQIIDPDTSVDQLDMRYISPIDSVEYQIEDIDKSLLNVLTKLGIYRISTYIFIHLQSGISIKLNKREVPEEDIDRLVTGMILKVELKQ